MEEKRQRIERQFRDSCAKHYDPLLKRLNRDYSRIFEVVGNHIDPAKKVLEAATGTGAIALGIADRALTVEACNISHEMIAVAQRKLSEGGPANVRFSGQDTCDLEYPDAAFDVVIASPEQAPVSVTRVRTSHDPRRAGPPLTREALKQYPRRACSSRRRRARSSCSSSRAGGSVDGWETLMKRKART